LGNTLELYGTTTGIDYLRLYSADLRVTNDYNGVIINIQDSGSTITFNNEGKDDSSEISQVNVDVNALSGQPQSIYFNNVDYSGAITLNSGNDYILFEENAEVDGSINFGNGDDQLQSFGANNLISADVDFGGGTDVFSVGDETMTVTGNMTGLENVEVFDGGLYQQQHLTVNNIVLGNSTLQIGAGKSVVTDAFSTDSGSILIFDVNSPANAGFLEVTDMGLDLTGLTVKANLTGADNVFTNGGTIAVATGDAPIIGYDGNTGFGPTVIDENSAMFSIMAMDGSYLSTPGNSSDLYFVFDQESTIEEIANTSNNKNAGRILDTISGTSDPELSEVIGHINAGDEDEVNDIISTLTPTVDVGGAVGTQNFVNNTLDVTNDRISSLQDNETSMSAGNESGLRAWSQVFGQRNLQGEREGIAGYDSNTYGAAFGLDTKSLVDNALLGAVISYGNTDVDSNNANSTSTGIDSYQFTLYGDYDFEKGSYARAMAAYSYNDVDTVRHNVGGLGVNAHGDYQADVYTLRTETGHDFKYANTRITPNLMAHYSHYNAEGYTEKGAGGAGLKVDGNSMNIFEVGAGVESGWDFKTEEGESIKPELRAGYRYDLIGDNLNISSSFVGGGSSFDTQGADPARGTISLGGGLTYYTVDNWEVSGNYEFEHKSDYNSNSGFLRAAYKF
jgi:outer membrane autotransporter protein